MTEDNLVIIEHDGPVAIVTINRPAKLNALNAALVDALYDAFEALAARQGEQAVRCAVLTGAGKAFIAGADISAMAELPPAEAKRFAASGQRLGGLLEGLAFPVIAAVNGFALGGGLEMALACDFIYASSKARLGLPEVSLGVIPGFGGTQRLARRVGIGMARELVYSGGMLRSDEALRIGLVNKVLDPDELLPAARKTAQAIATMGPLAVGAAKRVILRGEGCALDTACELETAAFAGLFGSQDQRAGMSAFLKKEKATFSGR